MKNKLPLILLTALFLFPINTFSQNYYYYESRKIELVPRKDKIALILKSSSFADSFVRAKLSHILNSSNELKKATGNVYIINLSKNYGIEEIDSYINSISQSSELVKFATRTYCGTSKAAVQIPTDEIIVRLKNPGDKSVLDAITSGADCQILEISSDGKKFLIKSNDINNKNALELSQEFFSKGIFEFCEPNFLYPDRCLLTSVPNDPYFPVQWALNNTGQTLQTGSWFLLEGDWSTVNGIPDSDMDVSEAWDITTGSPSVTIGVVDTGIDSLHPDFQSPDHLLAGYDAYYNVNSCTTDPQWHGTSTAGLIGAVRNNSIGISGIAPDCKIMCIKIFDENGNTTSWIIARGFDTARVRGIDILSNSWGGGSPSSTITNAVNNAAINGRNGLGCAIFFASGNDGRNPPIYPSSLENVMSVGASTPHDQKKSPGNGNQFFWGSNYGGDLTGDLDLTAPTNCYTLAPGGAYDGNFWGTSATAPNAAGVAALILSVNTSQTRLAVYENIARGCDKIDNAAYAKNKSYGKWNDYFGYGRINALNSVKLAAGIDITPPTINHYNVASHSNTYPTIITAEIIDNDGSPIPSSGDNQPKVFFKTKKSAGSWSAFDSATSFENSGNVFKFRIPSQGWETEVQYYIKAADNSGNETTFPKHSPDPFWLCYFSVGEITTETKKIGSFSGNDYGSTVSPGVTFSSFKILNTRIKIYMRHTYLDDEVISIFSPLTDVNNNRKCLFSSNGGQSDNITGAEVSDSASLFWIDGSPPYVNGHFMPDYITRGLNGQNAQGNWRILHFDRALGDYAFFDSIKITLSKTTGAKSSAVKFDNPEDSIVTFDSASFPNSYTKNYYLKNSGTSNLNVTNFTFSGEYAAYFSLMNVPANNILPGDSGLFVIKLNSAGAVLSNPNSQYATFDMQTNDPSKPVLNVSLQTNDSFHLGSKYLQLTSLIEGLYNPESNSSAIDTLHVELRNSSVPFAVVDFSEAVIDSNGQAVFRFANAQNNVGYYIAVKYRNSIQTWSAAPNAFESSGLSYNFTTDSLKAFGNNLVSVGGKYCIYSGDTDLNGIIDATDLSSIDNASANFITGYVVEDLNLDGIVDATDIGIADNNVYKQIIAITP